MPMLGILWVPEQFVLKTAGAQKYSKSQPHIPSLCLLFQHSRCNSREACNQIHIEREFADHLRHLLNSSNISNCCRYHGDLGSSNSKLLSGCERVEMRPSGLPPVVIPSNRIAVTEYWSAAFSWNYLREKHNILFFSPSRVCNLHQRQACKYGSACKNVHICRDFWMQLTQPYARPEEEHMKYSTPQAEVREIPEVPVLPPKRVSRALPIVDPSSGQEVQVVDSSKAAELQLAMADLNLHASNASEPISVLDLFGHKADEGLKDHLPEDPFSFSMEHFDMMAMTLNLGGFQDIFPLPFDLENDFQCLPGVGSSKPPAAQVKPAAPCESPINSSFNGRTPRAGSPSNSSGTDMSFGEDSGEDDLLKRGSKPLYTAFWGSVLPTPAVVSSAAPGS
eukprot:EG_transcript_4942